MKEKKAKYKTMDDNDVMETEEQGEDAALIEKELNLRRNTATQEDGNGVKFQPSKIKEFKQDEETVKETSGQGGKSKEV